MPLALTVVVVAVMLGIAQGSAGGAASVTPTKGTYSGHTKQDNVLKSARAIGFKVNGKRTRISLTTEPVIARQFCASPPVFLLDVNSVSTKLKRGKFSFSATFSGSKINKIKGQFVTNKSIEGEITYFFATSDAGLCSAGKTTTTFTAKK